MHMADALLSPGVKAERQMCAVSAGGNDLFRRKNEGRTGGGKEAPDDGGVRARLCLRRK